METDWPARAYCYGTFGYALSQTILRAKAHKQQMFVYQGVLDGEVVWIGSWDPKKEKNS